TVGTELSALLVHLFSTRQRSPHNPIDTPVTVERQSPASHQPTSLARTRLRLLQRTRVLPEADGRGQNASRPISFGPTGSPGFLRATISVPRGAPAPLRALAQS